MRLDHCGAQLQESLKLISQSEGGVLIYLRCHEGRGIGLSNKIKAYALQNAGQDTVEANISLGFAPDVRDYGIAAQILKALGVKQLRLLSNNPQKADGLERYGLKIKERLPLIVPPSLYNVEYLKTKREKFGNSLS